MRGDARQVHRSIVSGLLVLLAATFGIPLSTATEAAARDGRGQTVTPPSLPGSKPRIQLAARPSATAPRPTGAKAAHARPAPVRPGVKPTVSPKAAAPKAAAAARSKPTAKPAVKPSAHPGAKPAAKTAAATPSRTARPAARPAPAAAARRKPTPPRKAATRTKSRSTVAVSDAGPAQPVAAEPAAGPRRVTAVLGDEDLLIDVLLREDVLAEDVVAAVEAVEEIEDRAPLVPGDRVELVLEPSDEAPLMRLIALTLHRPAGITRLDRLGDGSYGGPGASPQPAIVTQLVSGAVDHTFDSAVQSAGGTPALARSLAKLFGLDAAQVAAGSQFEALIDGAALGAQRLPATAIRYAALTIDGFTRRVYRFASGGGTVGHFDEDGRSVTAVALAMPVEGARVTSEHGWRRHPILKRRMFHRGVDLAAPVGTPVTAAADGVVEWVGWRGNYGRYVRISHGARLSTGYGHLRAYADGLQVGSIVRQGDQIGTVGSSGRSTGPHLDFTVLMEGRAVDPMASLDPAPAALSGDALMAFHRAKEQLRGQLASAP